MYYLKTTTTDSPPGDAWFGWQPFIVYSRAEAFGYATLLEAQAAQYRWNHLKVQGEGYTFTIDADEEPAP
jgi:hypothetical protein